ncbi:hypothetical protein QBC32DRAFT_322502 [Pseudoneurospora amorphoporcata]|uniref:Uncharacterized protein n=1 Tax=Pseudoneurospora amorphoporcata TaxID=241081 RepID=A0AAN6NYZ2_9PEZI|nr:hypothetical protein QBC32DRAFT_322502 [Pseudoneurospora amorphoporcata]
MRMIDAMGIQVELSSLEPPRRSSPFAQQQYGPWHYHDVRSSSRYGWGEGAALISNAFSEGRLAGGPICSGAEEGGSSKSNKKTAAPRPALVVERALEQQQQQQQQQQQPGTNNSTGLPEVHVLPEHEPVQLPPPSCASTTTSSSWPLAILIPAATTPILTFPLVAPIPDVQLPSRPRPNLKRARPSTDVDGHNTAPLACKKRRLRLHVVTSRLSCPFSLPATHILHRESILKGCDKRLRSIAAAANRRMAMAGWGVGAAAAAAAGGQNGSVPLGGGGGMTAMGGNGGGAASWLRKMAVMNRFRMRMLGENMARARAQQQQQQQAQQAAQAQGQGQAAGQEVVVPGGHGVGCGQVQVGGNAGGVVPIVRSLQQQQQQQQQQQPQAYLYGAGTNPQLPLGQLLQAAAGGQPGRQAPTGFPPPPVIHTNTNTTTSSGPLAPPAPSAPRHLPRSPPRLHPLRSSPDLVRPLDDKDFHVDEDEDVAFPTSAHESRYEGEEDEDGHEVYADFGVLFGGDDVDEEEEEGNSLSCCDGEMGVEQQQQHEYLGL